MESILKPETLDALGKASGFVIITVITILIIGAFIYFIRVVSNILKQNNEEMSKALSLYQDNIAASRDNAAALREIVAMIKIIERAMSNQDRVVAQAMGTVEAQGIINSKLGDTLNLIEVSFRTHNKAVTDTLAMLSFDVNDLQDIVNKRADSLTAMVEMVLKRLDALPADVGNVVKEHIAVMLLQSTPAPKKITGEVKAAILAEAKEKPRVINGAAVIDSEADKGVD